MTTVRVQTGRHIRAFQYRETPVDAVALAYGKWKSETAGLGMDLAIREGKALATVVHGYVTSAAKITLSDGNAFFAFEAI